MVINAHILYLLA